MKDLNHCREVPTEEAPGRRVSILYFPARTAANNTTDPIATSPNVEWLNAQNSTFTGIQPSYGDAYTAQPPARGDLSGRCSFERTDAALSEPSPTTSLFPSGVAYDQDPHLHPTGAVSTISFSDGTGPQQTSVPIAVPHPEAQTISVGANNG